MREIKFRGYSLIGKRWVYGSYFTSDHSESGHCILNKSGLGHHEVDQKSVCQYTGLKDKNGVEIYIGYILCKDGFNWVVEDCFEYGAVKMKPMKKGVISNPRLTSFQAESSIVIGNIYENPELLEGDV